MVEQALLNRLVVGSNPSWGTIRYIVMTRTEMQIRVRELREELENRVKTGLAKMADADGSPISVQKLQDEMYSLIYKLSKID